MSVRQKIRDYLRTCDGPAWGCEIVAAVGCIPRDLSRMVADGTLVKCEERGATGYVIGKLPRKAMTPEEFAAARRAAWRKQDDKRRAKRAAEGRQRRSSKNHPAVKRVQIVLASKHETVGGESVAEYLARGGRIERLPGIQKSTVYQQRRPQMAQYRSMA